jgi:hypothetical protein
MADRKISDLTALTTPASGDYLPIVDISEAAAASKNKRITIEELMRGVPDGTAAAPGIAFETYPSTGIYSSGANQLAVATNGTGRLFVDASGNVGIGAAPGYALDVISQDTTVGLGYALRLRTNATAGAAAIQFTNLGVSAQYGVIACDSSSNLKFFTGATERMRIDSAGLVGIGNSSPQAALDIGPGAYQSVRTYLSSVTDTYHLYRGTPDGVGFEHARVFSGRDTSVHTYGSYLAFYTEGKGSGTTDTSAERLRIDSSGRVGINTASPAYAFVVSAAGASGIEFGPAYSGTANLIQHYSRSGSVYVDAVNDAAQHRFQIGGAEAARIDSSSRLLVGTSTARNKFFNTTYTPQLQLEGVGQQQSMFSLVNSVADNGGAVIALGKQRSGTIGGNTIVNSGDSVGQIDFFGSDGTEMVALAEISASVDGTPGANDMPGTLTFSSTPSGSASPVERLRITSAGVLQVADAGNITVGTTTGTKIGTATTQKIGFYNATPVVQPAAVADATDAATGLTQLNDLLAKLRTLGIIAT